MEGFDAYLSLTAAIRSLLRHAPAEPISERFWDDCCEDARTQLGQDASDELRFDLDTFERTRRLLGRINAVRPVDKARDDELLGEYNVQAAMHTIGVVGIMAACGGSMYTAVGLESCFELARGGALRAYAAARSAVALRTTPVPVEPGEAYFDREDAYLAGITGHA